MINQSGYLPTSKSPLIAVMLVCLLVSGQVWAGKSSEPAGLSLAVGPTLLLVYLTNAFGADRMAIEAGNGDDVNVVRMSAQWDWNSDLLEVGGFTLDSYWQLDYSGWQSTLISTQEGVNNTLGFTPVFRFLKPMESMTFYLDTGIGFYLFSTTQINDSRFGSNFQFGNMVGAGLLFGERRQWGLGYKFQHHSNNSMALPNDGINFHFLTLSYQYQ